MSIKKICLILCVSFFVISCSNKPLKPTELNEVFVTDIKPGGLKVFNYSLTKTPTYDNSRNKGQGKGSGMHGGSGQKKGMGGRGSGNGQADQDARMKQQLTEMLKAKLEKTAYCREGYIELGAVIGNGWMQIRGECEEGATDADREKFVNS